VPESTLRQILDSALEALADPDEPVLQEMDRWALSAWPIYVNPTLDTQRN